MLFLNRYSDPKKNPTFFLKLFFDRKKLCFFDGIFFKVHLLIQENRLEAISERFQQFKGGRTGVENVLILRYHVLCSKKKHSYIIKFLIPIEFVFESNQVDNCMSVELLQQK